MLGKYSIVLIYTSEAISRGNMRYMHMQTVCLYVSPNYLRFFIPFQAKGGRMSKLLVAWNASLVVVLPSNFAPILTPQGPKQKSADFLRSFGRDFCPMEIIK